MAFTQEMVHAVYKCECESPMQCEFLFSAADMTAFSFIYSSARAVEM